MEDERPQRIRESFQSAEQSDDAAGTRVGPYEIIRLIGAGGMGRVYLARRADGAFDRLVAVKMMSVAEGDGHAVARFEQERRVLARLHHPCIAELIDAGHTSANQLYFVMEYVDGVAITRFAEERSLPLRERVTLFRRVCEAVSEAHRHLVVHRDLKPGNILVDPTGTPKLVDFGIAKPLTPAGLEAGAPTDHAHLRATPGYASPEQVKGDSAHVGMDVFSLGVVLHELLSGRLPVPAEPNAITSRSGSGFAPPSVTAGAAGGEPLAGDLDAIILKCLHIDRRQRYSSVDRLSEDLLAWLDDRPVTARPDTTWSRTRRFVRRNRALSVLAGAAAVAVVVAAIASAGLWRTTSRERERERDLVARARTLASATFDLDRWLLDLPGSTEARRQLVTALGSYLQDLDVAGDAALAMETAESLRRLGDIWGGPGGRNLGDPARAKAYYLAALAALEAIDQAGISTSEAQRSLARTHAALGDVLADQGDGPAAEGHYSEALSIADRLSRADPMDAAGQTLVSGILRPMSDVKVAAGDTRAALEHVERALALDLANARRFGDAPEYRRLLVLDHVRIARIQAETGALDEALESLRLADTELEWLRGAGQDTVPVRREAAVSRARLATVHERAGDRSSALDALSRAIGELRALVESDVHDARASRDLVAALVQRADLSWSSDRAAARRALDEARRTALVLTAAQPDDGRAARDLEAVDQRLTALARGLERAELQLYRIDGHRRIELTVSDTPAIQSSIAAVASAPPGWTDYLLVFGADGPAELVDVATPGARDWVLTLAGPPPTQTVLLLSVPVPLGPEAKRRLVTDIAMMADKRVIEPGEHVSWSFNEPRLESLPAPRGQRSVAWVDAIRARLDDLGRIAVSGRTFPVAARPVR